ncbi:MAG TPA: hypothetical protein VMG08_09840 [Allosphingosinicella sp.]|nr:hypothetical protein [Allosphingosinicella sp.]
MTGPGGFAWGTLAQAFFYAAVGVTLLLPQGRPAPEPAWLIAARAQHGMDPAPPAAPSPWWSYAGGAAFLLLALLQLTSPVPSSPGRVFLIAVGGFFLAMGLIAPLVMLLLRARASGAPRESRRERRHRLRLEDRLARGKDAYFEELRSLLQPTPFVVRSRGTQVIVTLLLTLAGAALLAAGLATPR